MPEDRDELIQHYIAMRADFLEAIEGMDDAALTNPALDGWSVKDHLAHLATWDELRADEVARIAAGNDTVWRMTEDQVSVYNDIVYELRKGISVGQARWELAATRERLLAAIRSAEPRAFEPTLYGEAVLRSTHETEHAAWIRAYRASLRRTS